MNKSYKKNILKQLQHNLKTKNNSELKFINIFEDILINKGEIIISKINNILSKTSNKVFAKNCLIKEVNYKDSKIFLNNNHLQGFINSSVSLGLYYKDELISLMNFGKERKALGNKKSEKNNWELLRFCNKLNYSIVGGASKLLKYFKDNYKPKYIVSYCDKNWSVGNLYEKLNFNKVSETESNYWLCKDGKRNHRFTFRKDKLVKMGYNKNKTEVEIMEKLGYNRIYDCGSIKFELML